jgi:hypothetical protein
MPAADTRRLGRTERPQSRDSAWRLNLAMPFRAAYMSRPRYILPVRGVRSKSRLHRASYDAGGWLYPVIRALIPRHVTTTVNVGEP